MECSTIVSIVVVFFCNTEAVNIEIILAFYIVNEP